MRDKINWGIIATGSIANQFAVDFKRVKNGSILAVASREKEKAKMFAKKHNIPRYYGSYEELVTDPDIDAVYVSTPNNLHKENTIMSLKAGKAVLCEKPFAINKEEAEEMIKVARKNGVLLMEAMRAYFNQPLVKLRDLLQQKIIGDILYLRSDVSFFAPFNEQSRLFNPQLGGGALLDVGIYNIALAYMIFGKPDGIKSSVVKGDTGVDEQNSVILEYKNNRIAQFSSSFRYEGDREAFISGTRGSIFLRSPWYRTLKITIKIRNKKDKIIKCSPKCSGLNYETEHFNQCLLQKRLESDIMPHNTTLAIMEIMDEIRKQWNMKYPVE